MPRFLHALADMRKPLVIGIYGAGAGSAKALVAAAQMNTVEFHTWNSTARKIDQPDRIVFDLDPRHGVSWAELQEAALLTRTLLHELGLGAWLKMSGGKGLHVLVPIQPRPSTPQAVFAGRRGAHSTGDLATLRGNERTGQPFCLASNI